MPQVDLEALVSVCGGADRKIACETLADDCKYQPKEPDVLDDNTGAEVPPDFPPESFWLSKDAEIDWFDRNAFLERKESTKGNSNSANSNPNSHQHSNSSSQRFSASLKSKALIIGLPQTQKTNYVDTKRRNCKPPNIRLFPKRTVSVGKSAVQVTEPSSPNVSCMGRVRSKGRRRSSQRAKTSTKAAGKERTNDLKKTGFYSRLMSIFRSVGRRRDKRDVESKEPPVRSPPMKTLTVTLCEKPVSVEPVADPPGLGGMNRFASGRRSESWSTEDFDVPITDLFDSESRVGTATDGPTGRS